MNRKITLTLLAAMAMATPVQGEQVFATANVNIHTDPWIESDVVSCLPVDGVAEVEETDENGWMKITSGDVSGYIAADYITSEAPEDAYTVAVVNAEALNVREDKDAESGVLDVLNENQEVELVEDHGSHAKVVTDDGVYGYVNADYVSYKTYYPTAKLYDEEYQSYADQDMLDYLEYDEKIGYYYNDYPAQGYETEISDDSEDDDEYHDWTYYDWDEESLDQIQDMYEEDYSDDIESDEVEYYEDETEYTSAETPDNYCLGAEIANYATQFVGNPYVYGGTSLTNGTDCSGFCQSVFAAYGIGLPRVAADQAYSGTQVSLDSVQPGDLVYYGDVSHIAIYIGNGQIVHAANSNSGIIISDMYYSSPTGAVRVI